MEDLIFGYQTNKSVTQKSQALADERKAFDGEKEQVETAFKAKIEGVTALSKHLEQQLVAEFEGIDWEALRIDNPAEWSALKQEFATKASSLQNIQSALKAETDQSALEVAEKNQQARGVHLKSQFTQMIENNPEWGDEKVRTEALDTHVKFITETYGFTEKEFADHFDSRLVEIIKDAKKFRDGTKVAEKKLKKKVPKFRKSRGAKKKKASSKLDKLTVASKNASGAAKRDLQSSAVAELLTGAK